MLASARVVIAVILATPPLFAQAPGSVIPDSLLPGGAVKPQDAAIARFERGASIGVIHAADGSFATATTFSAALAARLPGVVVTPRSGILGAGSHIWLRGPSSASYNEPILIIDGIRAISDQGSGLGSATLPSRLDDLDPNMIERVEVLRGVAAAAMYGIGAAKGVILVTTKRARADGPRWEAFAEAGTMIDPVSYPANYGTTGVDASGLNAVEDCPLLAQTTSSCTALALRSWNPIESASPFRTGSAQSGGLTLSNAFGGWRVGGGVGIERASGVRGTNRLEATTARANVSGSILRNLALDASTFYRDGVTNRPDEIDPLIEQGLLGESVDDPVNRGYAAPPGPPLLERERYQNVNRLTASARLSWQPLEWLESSVVAGLDRARHGGVEHYLTPQPFDNVVVDSDIQERGKPSVMSVEVDATGSYSFGRSISGRTTLGVGYWNERDRASGLARFTYRDLDSPDLDPVEGSNDWYVNLRTAALSPFIRQQLSWADRVFFGANARRDKLNDVFPTATTVTSYSLDAAWRVLGDTRDLGRNGMRLRVAYGEGGDVAFGLGVLDPDDIFQSSGDPFARTSERTSELEIGTDIALLSGRVGIDITHYRSHVRNGIGRDTISSYLGFEERVHNHARLDTRGVEASLVGRLFDRPTFAWDVGLIGAFHEQTVRRPRIRAGSPGDGPLGEYLRNPFTFSDTDLDGLIGQHEVVVSTDLASFGTPIPKRELALRSTATVFGAVRIGAVVEHRGGHQRINTTRQYRCSDLRPVCAEAHDPSTSMYDQATIAGRYATSAGFIEDADFTRLREVALSAALPSRWASFSGAKAARFSLTGHNLATWTSYRGLDPEINPARSISPSDTFTQPLLRTFTVRLDLSW